ncbi:alpha/beta hydrolase [Herbaspirillum sp. RTI4]|uniref:alpha/beta hydrolase n=1 Tax=Herbaspirillum sp. RTI4 TaxID=3048640 RepID=UPI002AB3AF03|nr:alpha/beta hydrolase [Herbaspirillum sp. RTI4]MDY7579185.1 alpha/beta hydrolase [Herbaspirillum sp. RTI4]MEA9983233.1 alpha/beta hydrolase [Herbaspirillum sp. RTI4]
MNKPILHFSHANSYPAGTYGLFFEQLRTQYDVRSLAMHAHDPRYPVDDGWRALTRELIATLTTSYRGVPVILVGHSMGGLLSLMAANVRPDLVRCVVLLDSPVVAGWRAAALRMMKLLKMERSSSPSRVSARRRTSWPDREAAYQHYAGKKVFSSWPQQVLRDYVEHGMGPSQGEVQLRFRRETETQIYQTVPHHLGRIARRPFPVPLGFVGGIDSVECRLAGLAATRRLAGKHFVQIPGGHLFPMESPVEAAQATMAMIGALLPS